MFPRTLSAWTLSLVFSVFSPLGAFAQEVVLQRDPGELGPGETLEFRFPAAMVGPEELGVVDGPGPLRIDPPVDGTFTWLSTRSGVFVPGEVLPLDTKLRISLRRGLKDAAGEAVRDDFSVELSTPGFQITQLNKMFQDEEQVPANAMVRLAFNAPVRLPQSPGELEYLSEEGKVLPAEVRYATAEDYFFLPPDSRDWEERSREKIGVAPGAPVDGGSGQGKEVPENFQNRLVITPRGLLDSGVRWNLVAKNGFESTGENSLETGPLDLVLGRVQPFVLGRLLASNYLNAGCSVQLEFSEPLAPDITGETASRYFEVSPQVANLRFEEAWKSMILRGDFEVGQEYTLHIQDGVISDNGSPFFGDRKRTFQFEAVAPRVYLPEVTATQWLGGIAKFPVQSVNVSELTLTAKLVPPTEVARAMAAFGGYSTPPEDGFSEGEIFRKVPLEEIVGRVVLEETVAVENFVVDTAATTQIDWQEQLGGRKAGVFFLTVEGAPAPSIKGGAPGAQALVQLTDLGILWKKTEDALRVSVFSMRTGKPVAGAMVELLGAQFDSMGSATSDANGNAVLSLGATPAWLQVSTHSDTHVLAMGDAGRELPMAGFGLPVFYRSWGGEEGHGGSLRASLFTDRALYLPGDTVHLYGVVRGSGAKGLEIPTGAVGEITVVDSRWREVFKQEVRTDGEGSFVVDLNSANLAPGSYQVRLRMNEGVFSWHDPFPGCSFEIAEFRPDAFAVTMDAPSDIRPGERQLTVRGKAAYFFGAPVENASLLWTASFSPVPFRPEGFSDFEFLSWELLNPQPTVVSGESVTDPEGALEVAVPLPVAVDVPLQGTVGLEVTDLNQQSVGARQEILLQASEFYLGVKNIGSRVLTAGSEYLFPVIAVQPDGQPVKEPRAFNATLIRWDYKVVRVQGAGNAISFRTDRVEEIVSRASSRTIGVQKTPEGWSVEPGGIRMKPPKPGSYTLRVTAKDSSGRTVLTDYSFFVHGGGETVWDYRHPSQIDLVPDKPSYLPGETANILIKSPLSGEAMVTIERGETILRSFPVRLEGNAPVISVPLREEDFPNVFVSVVLVRGAEESKRTPPTPDFRYGVCELRLENPSSQLNVKIETPVKTFQPGEPVRSTVVVRDHRGSPVEGARVVFYAVDEGILSLVPYQTPNPAATFFAPFPLQVRTGLSLFSLLPEDPADLEFGNKGFLIGGGGMEGQGNAIREAFPGTAVWLPNLTTDREGKVSVEFAAPDALTSYRLYAVVHQGAEAFGSAENTIQIRKPLMIFPSLGLFQNVGDTVVNRVLIRNETGADGIVKVDLEVSQNAEVVHRARANVAILAGESAFAEFPLAFQSTGLSEWKFSASLESGESTFVDRTLHRIPVGSPMLLLRETYFANPSTPGQHVLTAEVNPQVLEGMGDATVTVSNTRLSSLFGSTAYLLEYPYGCSEQQISALVPWVIDPGFRKILGGGTLEEAERSELLTATMAKLWQIQRADGGIPYWPGSPQSSEFASAWAVIVLSNLLAEGCEMPEQWGNLLEYLSTSLRGALSAGRSSTLDASALSNYALALAGRPQPAYLERLFEGRAELSHEGRAFVALALMASGVRNEVRLAELLDEKIPAPDSTLLFTDAERQTAVDLLALAQFTPSAPQISPLVEELLAFRINGRWNNTQSNAWSLLALREAWRIEQAAATSADTSLPSLEGILSANSTKLAFLVTEERPVFRADFPLQGVPGEPFSLQVASKASIPLYLTSSYAVFPPLGEQPRQDRGFSVSRSYQKLAPDGALTPMDSPRVGDRILVTLRVSNPRSARFVVVEDPLPSLLEPIHSTFASRNSLPSGVDSTASSGTAWQSHSEMRADRVLFFCDSLPSGEYEWQYVARVRASGVATAPASKVSEMYRPERLGLGELQRITVPVR